jgi:hypothetical protein
MRHRASSWRLLLEYSPLNSSIRSSILDRKRADYFDCVDRLYSECHRHLWGPEQHQAQSQIRRDLPRTAIPLLRTERVSLMFERILFIWGTRHPASGYVQGMSDLLHPFFFAFLIEVMESKDLSAALALADLDAFPEATVADIEADCFWCFSKLLDGLQDCFTKDQPGLHRMLEMLANVVERVNPGLAKWIAAEGIPYCEFAFRWMNCLLVREVPIEMALRLWDLYVAYPTKISTTHVYVCAAFLGSLSARLCGIPREQFVVLMQRLAQEEWPKDTMDVVLAQAYVYEKMFAGAPSHLQVGPRGKKA